MANHISHAALPYPIKNARFTAIVTYLDADGDPTDPTTPDTEVTQDGAAAADTAEEVTTISGSNGEGYITFTGAEMNNSAVGVALKVASGPKNTLMTIYPRVLAVIGSGTLAAGSAGGGTLGTLLAYDVTGCFIRTTGGTGGGGTGGANNQARKIITYNTTTGAFTVAPNWETTPDGTTTYDVLLPEGVTFGMLKALNPATAGRTAAVDASGQVTVGAYAAGQAPLQPAVAGRTVNVSAAGAVDADTKLIEAVDATNQIRDSLVTDATRFAGADIATAITNLNTLLTRLTVTRTDYLDKLAISGNVASSAEVTAVQNNTRVVRVVPMVFERPDAGSTVFRVELLCYDEIGNMEAPDAAPTISVVNESGTSRDANLDSTTMTLVSTGRYRSTYTIATAHALEQLVFAFSVVEGGATRAYANTGVVVDTTAVDFTSADRAKLDTLHDTRLTAGRASALDFLTGDAFVRLGLPANASTAADIAAIFAKVDTEIQAILDAVDTEVGLIKAKTDQLVISAGEVASSLSSAQRNSAADALLKRDWSAITGEARYSLINAGRIGFTKATPSGNQLIVFKEDGVTEAFRITLTRAQLDAISSVVPV